MSKWSKLKTFNVARRYWPVIATAVGAIVGYAVLHPVTMVIFLLDHNPPSGTAIKIMGEVVSRFADSFSMQMSYMSLHFILLGSVFGYMIGHVLLRLVKQQTIIEKQKKTLQGNITKLLEKGENESVEYKSSLRWDLKLCRINRQVEHAAMKSIAGFMNCRGGTLILGVNDHGVPLGIEPDFATLKRKDADGFEQYVIQKIASQLGSHICPWVHPVFSHVDGHIVCSIFIEATPEPVYLKDGKNHQFFLRTGNSTHELNVKDAIRYISHHWTYQ